MRLHASAPAPIGKAPMLRRIAPLALAATLIPCAAFAREPAPTRVPGKPIDQMTIAPMNPRKVTSLTKPARGLQPARLATPTAAQAGTVANMPICTAAFDPSPPRMIPDGAGGSFVVWHDYRTGDLDIYAQRL